MITLGNVRRYIVGNVIISTATALMTKYGDIGYRLGMMVLAPATAAVREIIFIVLVIVLTLSN